MTDTKTATEKEEPNVHERTFEIRHEYISTRYEYVKHIDKGTIGLVSKVRFKKNVALRSDGMIRRVLKAVSHVSTKKLKAQKDDEAGEKDNIYYAMKTVNLKDVPSNRHVMKVEDEINLLNRLDHPNIIKLQEVYEIDNHYFMIMDYCSGGNLYNRFPYTEKQASNIILQVLSAVKYLHQHGIVHRDLSFENILFQTNRGDDDYTVKLVGFSMSARFYGDKNSIITGKGGPMYMMAPEVLDGEYTSQADLWSVGVIVYMLLSGERPFLHRIKQKLIEKIKMGNYAPMDGDDAHKVWQYVSSLAKDLIQSLLVVDPTQRLDAAAALDHRWLGNPQRLSTTSLEQLQRDVGAYLYDYKQTSALKKIALNIIAHRSTADGIVELRKIFAGYDKEQNGVITLDELKEGLKTSNNYSEKTIEEIFDSIDIGKTGNIMYTQFLAAALSTIGEIEEARIVEAFDKLDVEHTGYITEENLRHVLGDNVHQSFISDAISKIDINDDGKISYKEFLTDFRSTTDKMVRRMSQS